MPGPSLEDKPVDRLWTCTRRKGAKPQAALLFVALAVCSQKCAAQSTDTGTPATFAAASSPLRIMSWGGAYQSSQVFAFVEPFRRDRGLTIETTSHQGRLLALSNVVKAGGRPFDVADVDMKFANAACTEGLLEKLDPASLLGEGSQKDFFTGGVTDCALANTAWSTVFVYNNRAFFDRRLPVSALDVFDSERYPGKRVFPRTPRHILEAALIADRVPSAQVYKLLETQAGVTRAFSKLDRIKANIEWQNDAAEAVRLVVSKQAVFALSYSGRAFFDIVKERAPLGILWNGQIQHYNVWVVAKGTEKTELAKDFIKYALEAKRLASQTQWFPYGPARASAAAFVGKHAEIDMEMSPYSPTAPANLKNALVFDDNFWELHEASLSDRFNAWADGKINAAGAVPVPVVKTPYYAPQPRRKKSKRRRRYDD